LFQGARLFRVVRVLRVLRAFKSMRLIGRLLCRNPAKGVFASAATATILLVAFAAITMLLVASPHPESPINSAEEALWWAIVTVTTVGYGDYYPATTLGRMVAVILMICGVGLFGSFAAYISSIFIQDDSARESREARAQRDMTRALYKEVRELRGEIHALNTRLDDRAPRAESATNAQNDQQSPENTPLRSGPSDRTVC